MSKEFEELLTEIKKMVSNKADKLAVVNVVMASADKEYRWQFPRGCMGFAMQCRDGTAVRFSFKAGIVANSDQGYATIKTDGAFDETDLNIQSGDEAIYFACASAGKIVEIVVRQ